MIIRPNNGIFQQSRINIMVSSALPKIQQFVESKSAQQSFFVKTYPSTLQPLIIALNKKGHLANEQATRNYHRLILLFSSVR